MTNNKEMSKEKKNSPKNTESNKKLLRKKGKERCGFVAVLGCTNAGKSTLVNALVGAKVSIVSPKVQTTRMRIRGLAVQDNSQIILVDTPGIFKPHRRLDRAMVSAAWTEADEADVIMLVVDSVKNLKSTEEELEKIIAELKSRSRSAILVLNKIDLIEKGKLLALAQRLNEYGIFTDIFMVSAFKGECVPELLSFLAEKMPESSWLFPEDEMSDLPLRTLAAEITREKIYDFLHAELPYAITVETTSWEGRDDGSVRIEQTVFVERVSQRKIVFGAGGAKIKTIGTASRKELEEILECKVHLFITVKVAAKWGEDSSRYKALGLDFDV